MTAQLYNDSGTIRIMNGSSMVCIGNVTNASGTITNDGKLEVLGSFRNGAAYHSGDNDDSLLLTGTGNVTLNSGLAILNNLLVNKTLGGRVTLTANTTIGRRFDLLAGGFSTDPAYPYELIAPASTTFAFGTGTQITGKVRRTDWFNGNKIIFHQADMAVTTTNGIAPDNLLVNMVPDGNPTLSEKAVKRYFYFSPAGGSNYTADITFPYSSAELNTNTEANLVPWYHASYNKWNAKLNSNTNNTALHYITSTGIDAGIFANSEWKLADVALGLGSLFVYPIPAKNTMNIGYTVEKPGKATIRLLDVSGKVHKVLRKDILKGFNKFSLNITGLSIGQYILRVEEGNTVQTKVVLID
ncbi:MAG: T9SS type A sorting domain-containing protein [Segetibacter sp.]